MKGFSRVFFVLLLLAMSAAPLAAQTWPAPPEASALAGFGGALALDGDEIIAARTGVSAMFPEPPSQPGGLHIFARTDDGWAERLSLEPDGAAFGESFGFTLALDGDGLAVGAPRADNERGAVYLFERDGEGWRQVARLAASDAAEGAHFGAALALSGGLLVVGAPGHGENRGAVYAFRQREGRWEQAQHVSGEADGDFYGAALALAREMVLVGAPGHAEQGAVFASPYDADGVGWTDAHALRPDAEEARLFGVKLLAKGGHVFVAAPGMMPRDLLSYDSDVKAGAVFVFHESDEAWHQRAVLTPQTDDEAQFGIPPSAGFGTDLGYDGESLWVGAPLGNKFVGAVYRFAQQDDGWMQAEVIGERSLAQGTGFGAALAVSDDLAAVSALGANFGDGRTFVFEQQDEAWRKTGTIGAAGRVLEALTGETMRCTEGEVGPFSCDKVDLHAFLPLEAVGAGDGVIVNDLWGWTDPETGREIAIVGRSNGVSFLDITDPQNPVFLGDLPQTPTARPNAWRDLKVYQNHVFVVADNVGQHGMQVFDLAHLRHLDSLPATFEADVVYDKIYSAHNIVINEETGFAYIVAAGGGGESCGGGYHMVDIREPKNPQFVGCYNDPSAGAGGNHVHDAQCVVYRGPDADHAGKDICFGSNAQVFSITDVSDKQNPTTLAATGYPNLAYVHQGWLTDDQQYFYLNDEGDEVSGLVDGTRTMVWDVTDLDDPVVVTEFIGTTGASDHNLYVKGNLMYQSNYVSGLRIIDISDPTNPREVAHFDTVPWGENAPGFAGSWSNYPYFESGTIVVTSVKEGVFLLKKADEILP